MKSSKFEVITIGELNVDLILDGIDGFPEIGKEKLADNLTNTLGSSSAIFSSNLSSLGVSVGFIGKIGEDEFGKKVLSSLEGSNVDTRFVITDENIATGVTVALNYGEERAMITHQGAMLHLGIDDIADNQLKEAKHLHFYSYFLQSGIAKNLDVLMQRAKKAGLTTSFDPQWDPREKWEMDLRNILPYVDVFLPNEAELTHLSEENNLEKAIETLSKFGNVTVAKLGSNGSAFYKDGSLHKVEPYHNTNVVDAIGAGDSFNAGFISRFIAGNSIKECARFGNLTGAISTTESGGTKAFQSQKQIIKVAKRKFGLNKDQIAL
jgi:sugar/nucleoside kinase (ribokinase family)